MLVLLVAGLCLGAACAQGAPGAPASATPAVAGERGVVWHPPAAPMQRARDLRDMRDAGMTAVRLTRLPGDALLAHADTLGLRLYVDLPVAYPSASALQDSLLSVRRSLDRVLEQAARHPSIRGVGLARGADTTVPATCRILRTLAETVRARSADLTAYYVTPFPPARDQCAGAVDLVLVDVVDAPAPTDRWNAWRTATATPVGIGALGAGVQPGAPRGTRVEGSPEAQARYLETALAALPDEAPPVLFVHRWRDAPAPGPRRYGLHTRDGMQRPAARVVRGVFSGTQRVFAFPRGTPPPAGAPWLVVAGWVVVAGLGAVYASNVQVRRTLMRYFRAHGFYCDSVRRGRDLMLLTTTSLLVAALLAAGVVAGTAAQLVGTEAEMRHVLAALRMPVEAVVQGAVQKPGLWAANVAGAAALLAGVWAGALAAAARLRDGLSVAQVLMLMAWPCWPLLACGVAALVVAAQAPVAHPLLVAAALAGGSGIAALAVTARVLADYARVTGVPTPAVAGLAAGSPPVLVAGVAGLLILRYDIPVGFLVRLLLYA